MSIPGVPFPTALPASLHQDSLCPKQMCLFLQRPSLPHSPPWGASPLSHPFPQLLPPGPGLHWPLASGTSLCWLFPREHYLAPR